jgi:hypothetical protein
MKLKKCKLCGREFYAFNGEEYCTKTHEKIATGKLPATSVKKRICAECGKEFITTNARRRYCCVDCQEAHMKKAYVEKERNAGHGTRHIERSVERAEK